MSKLKLLVVLHGRCTDYKSGLKSSAGYARTVFNDKLGNRFAMQFFNTIFALLHDD